MRKFLLLLTPLAFLLTACLFSSCKDDDEPSAPPQVSMEDEEIEVDEGDGSIEVKLSINPAPANDIIIYYDLGGSAQEGADYEIDGESGEVEVSAGQTEAVIKINITNDDNFEQDETIVIELDEASDDAVIITNDNETTITIKNDDAAVIASFSETTMTVVEGRIIEIEIPLDKPSPQSAILQYSLAGTAVDSVKANSNENLFADYAILGGQPGSAQIEAGATKAIIRLRIYSDLDLEDTETISITLTGGTGIQLGTNKQLTLNVNQQDGLIIVLEWDESYEDVDMDMFLWVGDSPETFEILTASIQISMAPPEAIFIPSVFVDGTDIGMSYVYYEGSADPMNFKVTFIEFIDGQVEPLAERTTFEGTYTANNLNPWEDIDDIVEIEQTFEVENGEFVNFSNISIPSSGSRTKGYKIPETFKREHSKAGTTKILSRL